MATFHSFRRLLAVLLLLLAPCLLLLRHAILLLLRLTIALHLWLLLLLTVALHWLLLLLSIALHRLLTVTLSLGRLAISLGLSRLTIGLGLCGLTISLRLLTVCLRLLAVRLRLLAICLRLWLLTVCLRLWLLTVSLRLWLLSVAWLLSRLHTPLLLLLLWHTVALHGLLAVCLLLGRSLTLRSLTLGSLCRRLNYRCWLLYNRCSLNGLQKIVLLEVTAKLVVVDTLLKTDKSVVEFVVELSALLEEHLKVIGNTDSLVDLLEELTLRWIISHGVNHLLNCGSVLLDNHCDLLFLLLNLLVLHEVLTVLGLILLEDFTLLECSRMNLHKLFHSVKLVLHGYTIAHDLLLTQTALLKNAKLLLHC